MTDDFFVRELSLSFAAEKDSLIQFLSKHHLAWEEDIEAAYGIYDSNDELTGCGCCAGNLLKCFAVEESLRGQNALGSLVSRLVQNRFTAGYYDLFVITRPKNRGLFSSCGFYAVAETEDVVMLENKKNGVERFYKKYAVTNGSGAGCIVMNCNPFTLGHLALIRYAAANCSLLHIFVVEENRSEFPFEERFRLVTEGTADLPNVLVHPSGPYMISAATFPTYFLKKGEDAAAIQSELDITVFAERIAPLLSITKRFAGEEPFDPVTRRYNAAMRRILPEHGIEFIEIPRTACESGDPISASRVRAMLHDSGVTEEVLQLVPPCTGAYLKEKFGGSPDEN